MCFTDPRAKRLSRDLIHFPFTMCQYISIIYQYISTINQHFQGRGIRTCVTVLVQLYRRTVHGHVDGDKNRGTEEPALFCLFFCFFSNCRPLIGCLTLTQRVRLLHIYKLQIHVARASARACVRTSRTSVRLSACVCVQCPILKQDRTEKII